MCVHVRAGNLYACTWAGVVRARTRACVCVCTVGDACAGGGVHVCVDGMQMPGWGYFVCVHAQRVMHARAWVHV